MVAEKPTFAFVLQRIEQRAVMLFLHTSAEPDDATWDEAMRQTRDAPAGPEAGQLGYLVITDGGAPTTLQRKKFFEATGEARFPLAVVNASPVVRGVITAISWVNPGIKPFAPQHWADAVQYVGLSAEAAPLLRDEMRKLQTQLGIPNKCLDAVAAAFKS